MARHHHTAEATMLVHPLSVVRERYGWTYQDVVDVVAKRCNSATRREKAFRWENWGVIPDMASQLALAAELDVDETAVRLHPWPAWLPDDDPIPTALGWSQVGSLTALEDAVAHAMTDRRGFMKLVGSALVTLAQDWLNVEPAELVAVLRGGQVNHAFVDRIVEGLPRLRFLEASRGGGRTRRLIDAELGLVVDVLSGSAYTSAVGRRLHALAAELSRVAGWASFDAGHHAAAQRYWMSGLYASQAAGDRLLGANVLKSMSLQCYDFARPTEALALARSAYEAAAEATPRTSAMLALRQARAHAALGDAAGCERLLAAADTAFGRAQPTDDDPTWVAYFDHAEFHAQVGTCFLDLGRPVEADERFITTLELLPAAKVRDRATYLVRRASAQAQQHDADQAHILLGQALPLIEQAPSQRNIDRIRRARQRIDYRPGDPRQRELDERIKALVA
jgi:tetratricopeptide (TPR) repeat protein